MIVRLTSDQIEQLRQCVSIALKAHGIDIVEEAAALNKALRTAEIDPRDVGDVAPAGSP